MTDPDPEITRLKDEESNHRWTEKDTGWMFSHIGTGIGAGLLYLPVSAGMGGIWPLLILSFLSGPVVLLTHRSLTRLCLSSSTPGKDLTQVVHEHFGNRVGYWLMLICFMSMFPVLLLYSVGITNVFTSFVVNQLHFEEPARPFLVLVLVVGMVSLFCTSERYLLRLISSLVFPLTLLLMGIAVYLIPQWRMDFLLQPVTLQQGMEGLFLALPVMVFSFYHAPVCSSFARSYQQEISDLETCIRKTDKIHFRSCSILLSITFFFVFSCIMAMTPEQLLQAKIDNLPILSVLANRPGNLFFSTLAPIIAFGAILTSFFGFFLGTVEVMNGLLKRQFKPGAVTSDGGTHQISLFLLVLLCWIAGVGNWGVLNIMEMIVAPMMSVLLFFLPVVALYKVKRLKPYANKYADGFVLIIGTMVMLGAIISRFI